MKLPGNKIVSKIEPVEAWQKILSQDILNIIVHNTTLKFQEFGHKAGNRNLSKYREINVVEIHYFYAINF